MATLSTMTASLSGRVSAFPSVRSDRRRRISPTAGHALEKLGHAIEYLTDEYIHEGGTIRLGGAKLQAVELLMSLNRAVYFACPEVPTLAERWQCWLEMR